MKTKLALTLTLALSGGLQGCSKTTESANTADAPTLAQQATVEAALPGQEITWLVRAPHSLYLKSRHDGVVTAVSDGKLQAQPLRIISEIPGLTSGGSRDLVFIPPESLIPDGVSHRWIEGQALAEALRQAIREEGAGLFGLDPEKIKSWINSLGQFTESEDARLANRLLSLEPVLASQGAGLGEQLDALRAWQVQARGVLQETPWQGRYVADGDRLPLSATGHVLEAASQTFIQLIEHLWLEEPQRLSKDNFEKSVREMQRLAEGLEALWFGEGRAPQVDPLRLMERIEPAIAAGLNHRAREVLGLGEIESLEHAREQHHKVLAWSQDYLALVDMPLFQQDFYYESFLKAALSSKTQRNREDDAFYALALKGMDPKAAEPLPSSIRYGLAEYLKRFPKGRHAQDASLKLQEYQEASKNLSNPNMRYLQRVMTPGRYYDGYVTTGRRSLENSQLYVLKPDRDYVYFEIRHGRNRNLSIPFKARMLVLHDNKVVLRAEMTDKENPSFDYTKPFDLQIDRGRTLETRIKANGSVYRINFYVKQ